MNYALLKASSFHGKSPFFLLLLLLKGCTCNSHFIKIPESQHSPHLFTTTCKHTDRDKQTRTLYQTPAYSFMVNLKVLQDNHIAHALFFSTPFYILQRSALRPQTNKAPRRPLQSSVCSALDWWTVNLSWNQKVGQKHSRLLLCTI